MTDYMSSWTPFEQNLALSWASVVFADWLRENRDAPVSVRKDHFFDCIEGGLALAHEFRHENL